MRSKSLESRTMGGIRPVLEALFAAPLPVLAKNGGSLSHRQRRRYYLLLRSKAEFLPSSDIIRCSTRNHQHDIKMRRYLSAVTLLFLMQPSLIQSQDRAHARSMVITERVIVATSHYLASQAGAQMLARGGSAIDAAITANAVLGVTEPMMNGIGGDLFLLYWEAKTGRLYGLNASGWAPRNLTVEFLNGHGINAMPQDGIPTVTVPGAVDGDRKR